MEHVKGKIQQGAGNAYFAGMQWRGITLGHAGNDSNLLLVFYVQIVPDDFVMQLHRF